MLVCRLPMTCPTCTTSVRPGATQCRSCHAPVPPSCIGCGIQVAAVGELCHNCRTEKVAAAIGGDLAVEDSSLLEPVDEAPLVHGVGFVGRGVLLDQLSTQVVENLGRNQFTFLLLTGPPGIGKSSAVKELVSRVAAVLPQIAVLSASSGGAGAPPYAPFQRMLRDRLGIADSDPPRQARARLAEAVAALLPASHGTEVAHLLAQSLDCPFADSPIVAQLSETPAQLEMRTFIAVRRFLAADAAQRPLVLVFDDLERASPETVNLCHYLSAGLRNSAVAIVAIARPNLLENHPTFGQGDVGLERVEIGPLNASEARDLFRALVLPAEHPPADLLMHVAEQLGGVPRAIVELGHYLVEVGILAEADAESGPSWRFLRNRLDEVSLPSSLEEIVSARLSELAAAERAILEKAAACGETFWLDAVVALVRGAALERGEPDGPTLGEIVHAGDRTRLEVEATLRELERRGLLREQPHSSIASEREYRFAYPPWWEVVYEGIATDAVRRYHRLVAQWLELRPEGRAEEAQEEIAHHLERAGDGDAAALRFRRAAEAARARYFNDKAIRLYVAALGCLGPRDLPSRIHLWHDLGSVFQLKGDFDSALSAFERMLRLSWVVASRTKAAAAFNKMGRIYRQKGELTVALEYLERALDLFEQSEDERGIAGSLDDIGSVLWLLSRYDEALHRSASALEKRRRLGDRRSIATSLVSIGNIERHQGLFDEAAACYREALEIRTAVRDPIGIAQAQNGLAMLEFQRGNLEVARDQWEEALASMEEIGALPMQALLLNHLGEAALFEHHLGEARSRFDAAEQLARDIDDKRLVSEALRNLGLVDLQEGDRVRAMERCRQALDIATLAGIRVDIGRALLALGQVHSATLFDETSLGVDRAETFFRKGVSLFREIGNDAELAIGLEQFGRFQIERGEVESGRQLLSEAQAICTRLGVRSGDSLERVLGSLSSL